MVYVCMGREGERQRDLHVYRVKLSGDPVLKPSVRKTWRDRKLVANSKDRSKVINLSVNERNKLTCMQANKNDHNS